VSNLALPIILLKGLGALGYSHNPDIIVFLLVTRTIKGIRCLKCNALAQVIKVI